MQLVPLQPFHDGATLKDWKYWIGFDPYATLHTGATMPRLLVSKFRWRLVLGCMVSRTQTVHICQRRSGTAVRLMVYMCVCVVVVARSGGAARRVGVLGHGGNGRSLGLLLPAMGFRAQKSRDFDARFRSELDRATTLFGSMPDRSFTAPLPNSKAEVQRGLLALGAVQLCFGLFPVFGRLAMDPVTGFAPFAVACWRIGIGSVVLLALCFALYGRRTLPSRSDLLPLAFFGFLGIVLNQGLFLVGLQRSTPMNAGLVICLIPVFAYSVAVLGKRETFHSRRALGVVVALAGAVPLFLARGADLGAEHAFGNLLMAGNALCYAIYLVYSKPLLKRMPPLVLVAWVYVLSLQVRVEETRVVCCHGREIRPRRVY